MLFEIQLGERGNTNLHIATQEYVHDIGTE